MGVPNVSREIKSAYRRGTVAFLQVQVNGADDRSQRPLDAEAGETNNAQPDRPHLLAPIADDLE